MPTRPLLFLAALAVLALAGCGDDGFEGTAGVPDGYATYEGNGRHVRPPRGLEGDDP